LTNQLKVFVKICELDPRTPFARDIAIRSNTQSAVNSRNLRALDGPQLRLTDEFKSRFPDITYETRPDKSLDSSHSIIQNHQAARCLCAVMNRRPWLAIKNLSLFDDPNYAAIFNEDVHAEQVFFCSTIRELVDEDRDRFPASYRRSWVLTSIIATYLAAEALRALRNDEDLHSLAEAWVEETEVHQKDIEIAIDAARKTLELRRDDHQLNDIVDDFKVDFKNEGVLRKLGGKAREVAIILRD
ncbi:MAG: AIPR family protein, partial [Chloroflexota bacterium]|nr:AIPR family protein [Chloroflexota bacterium]